MVNVRILRTLFRSQPMSASILDNEVIYLFYLITCIFIFPCRYIFQFIDFTSVLGSTSYPSYKFKFVTHGSEAPRSSIYWLVSPRWVAITIHRSIPWELRVDIIFVIFRTYLLYNSSRKVILTEPNARFQRYRSQIIWCLLPKGKTSFVGNNVHRNNNI